MSTLETNSIGKYSGNNVSIDDALNLKSYTTAQRDALTSVAGDIIYNTTESKPQIYNGTAWEGFSSSNVFQVDYLVVAGGASGLAGVGGGGGGGGVVENTGTSLVKGVDYYVTIGGGGAQVNGNAYNGNIGNNSQFLSIAGGGGYGGGQNAVATQPPTHNGSGGGGGGGTNYQAGNQTAGSAGSYGDANAGGTGTHNGAGGGGGGASAAGGNASGSVAGDGGEGNSSSITGTSDVYGSGGGGGTSSTTSSNAGTGGTNAGDGGFNSNANNSGGIDATAGTANKGGGGGGSGGSLAPNFRYGYGEAGGSGVVIVRWATADATIGATRTGLTDTGVQADGADSYIVFTAGTGNITFS